MNDSNRDRQGTGPEEHDPAAPDPARTGPAEGDPARTFRIGHRERDDAIEVLREAAGDGRITVEELETRMEQVQSAKFPIDLDAVLSDLTTDLPSSRFRPQQQLMPPPSTQLVRTGRNLDAPLVIKAGWESETRRGRWRVPPAIRAEPSMSSIELNFLEVETDLVQIDLEIVAGMGGVTVVVPAEWGVDVEELSKSWGSVKSAVDAIAQDRAPTIVVSGSIGMGTFRARFANYFDRRRMNR